MERVKADELLLQDDDSDDELHDTGKQNLLDQIYFGSGEGAYASLSRLLAAAKRSNPSITKSDVAKYLSQQDVASIFFEDKPDVKPSRSHHCADAGALLSLDIMYSKSLSSAFPYTLVAVDCFSKYGYLTVIYQPP